MEAWTNIGLFGELVLRAGSTVHETWPTARCREVLGYLLLRPTEPVPRTWLIQNVWPAIPVDQCRNRLSVTLSMTKRALQASGLDMDSLIQVKTKTLTALDLGDANEYVRFKRLCQGTTPEELREAITIHRAPLLVDVAHPWALAARSEAQVAARRAALALAKFEEDEGNDRSARVLRERAEHEYGQ